MEIFVYLARKICIVERFVYLTRGIRIFDQDFRSFRPLGCVAPRLRCPRLPETFVYYFKDFADFYLNDKAIIWPGLSYMCHVRSRDRGRLPLLVLRVHLLCQRSSYMKIQDFRCVAARLRCLRLPEKLEHHESPHQRDLCS